MCQHWLQDLDAIQAIVDAALLSPVAQEVTETSHTSFLLVSRYRTLFVICILKKWNPQRFEILNFMGLFFFNVPTTSTS